VLSIAIPKPPGLMQGDVMLLHVAITGPGTVGNVIIANPVPPPGFVLMRETQIANTVRSLIYLKVASSLEPTGYRVTFGLPVQVAGAIGAWSGVNTTAPIADIKDATAVAAKSVTVPPAFGFAGGRVVGVFATLGYPIRVPTNMTSRWSRSTPQAIWEVRSTTAAGDEARTVTGLTGNRIATSTNFATWIGHLVSLRPAA
jgi:hypothetical protein